MINLILIWPLVTGAINRIRGGWLWSKILPVIPFWGTSTARLTASIVTLLPLFLVLPYWKVLIAMALYYVGLMFGWSKWQYMENRLPDTISMGLRGLVLTGPVGLFLGSPLIGLSGFLMGPSYVIPTFLPFLKYKEPNGYTWVASDFGEVLFGVVIGIVVVISCL